MKEVDKPNARIRSQFALLTLLKSGTSSLLKGKIYYLANERYTRVRVISIAMKGMKSKLPKLKAAKYYFAASSSRTVILDINACCASK